MLDHKVDFALLLYDEFNGSAIADASVLFRCDGRMVTPLRKKEGFYVFRGLGTAEINVEISRPHYHKKQKRILRNRLDPGNPVARARLMREHPGAFADCEWLHGNGPPNSEVLAFMQEEQMKLQVGEEDKSRLTVLGYATGNLVGRRFALDKKNGGTFLITRMLTPGVYLADRALPFSPKDARPIIWAYLSRSGTDGKYHIPVEKGRTSGISDTVFYDRGRGEWVCASAMARE